MGREIRDKAQNLISASTPHCVYCIQIEYKYPSLQSLEREANVLFDEIPHWLRTAWDTEIALYVGYSSNFPDRVVAHSVGKLSDTKLTCNGHGSGRYRWRRYCGKDI